MEVAFDPRLVGALGLITLLTIAPGPDTALVISTALARGRGAAFRTCLGISTGTLVWATLSGFGIAALLAASAEVFALVRLAGAAYLVYLGLRTLAEAWLSNKDNPVSAARMVDVVRNSYKQGLLTNLLNPKVGLFYTTLVPQLIEPGDSAALASIGVGIAHAAIGITWLGLLAVLVDRATGVLRRPRVRRTLATLTGGILIVFGVRVAADPT